jgi:transcriptional regulator with XRE-family HTH domain
MTLADKLRKSTSLHNQRALANAAGVAAETLRKAMNGEARPRRATLAVIARILNVDAQWLSDDAQEWPPVWSHHEGRVIAFA